jgi:hypothetical protein
MVGLNTLTTTTLDELVPLNEQVEVSLYQVVWFMNPVGAPLGLVPFTKFVQGPVAEVVDFSHWYVIPSPNWKPVPISEPVPPTQILLTETETVAPVVKEQFGAVNSSAPISGRVAFRVSSSMSVVIEGAEITLPKAFKGDKVFSFKLLDVLRNNGFTETELMSFVGPVALCQLKSVGRFKLPIKPTLPPVET